MTGGLSAREVATIIGVPESRVRYWAQIGLVGPTYRPPEADGSRERPMYAFSDLVAARAARELTERGIPARRVREALIALRAQLPSLDRPLLHLRVLSDGERLVVAGDQPFEPLTGQRVMDFQLDELSAQVADLDARRREGVPRPVAVDTTRREQSGPQVPSTALSWFEEGLRAAAAADVERAILAYTHALQLDEHLGPAHANLGAIYAERGRHEEATVHLDAALRCDPGSIEARVTRAALEELAGQDAQALALWASLLADAPRAPARADTARAGIVRTAERATRRRTRSAL